MRPRIHPNRSPRRPATWLQACALCLCAACVPGCDRGESATEPEPAAPASTQADGFEYYTTRGRVEQLPDPTRPSSEFKVRHEAIDNFRHSDGLVKGMNSMIMSFPLAEGVTLDGLAVGDVIGFTFRMRFKPSPMFEITEMRRLDSGTELVFRKAEPPSPE